MCLLNEKLVSVDYEEHEASLKDFGVVAADVNGSAAGVNGHPWLDFV
jgi:hypothetical protein